MTVPYRPVVAVDFDATLTRYATWKGEAYTDEPIDGAVAFLKELHARGYDIVIFSARAISIEGQRAIAAWVKRHAVEDIVSGITHEKLYTFWRIVDDRAIPFRGSYEAVLEEVPCLH